MVKIKVVSLRQILSGLMCAVMLVAAIGMFAKAFQLIETAEAMESAEVVDAAAIEKADMHSAVLEVGGKISIVVKGSDGQIEENEHDSAYDAGEGIRIEIAAIEVKEIPKTDAPKVLIYHTHTYEAYEQTQDDIYVLASGAQWRTKDNSHNITRVGAELKELLEGYGFEVVHDTTEFEPPKLGTAYVRSLDMLERRMSAGEKYDMIIDMHRDSYSKSSWTPASVVVDGESAARLMFLVGTGEDGFDIKPNWQENYGLANQMIEYLQAINADLCKDANVKTQRYNQHVSTRCVLVEVGHCENTLAEALASMKYLAEAIDATLR